MAGDGAARAVYQVDENGETVAGGGQCPPGQGQVERLPGLDDQRFLPSRIPRLPPGPRPRPHQCHLVVQVRQGPPFHPPQWGGQRGGGQDGDGRQFHRSAAGREGQFRPATAQVSIAQTQRVLPRRQDEGRRQFVSLGDDFARLPLGGEQPAVGRPAGLDRAQLGIRHPDTLQRLRHALVQNQL